MAETAARRGLPPQALGLVVGAGVILAWELAARTVYAGTYRLSPPTAVTAEFFENQGLYLRNLWHSTRSAAWGFMWGNLAAIAPGRSHLAGAVAAAQHRRGVPHRLLPAFHRPGPDPAGDHRPGHRHPHRPVGSGRVLHHLRGRPLGLRLGPRQRPRRDPLPGPGPAQRLPQGPGPGLGAGHVRRPADRGPGRLPGRGGRRVHRRPQGLGHSHGPGPGGPGDRPDLGDRGAVHRSVLRRLPDRGGAGAAPVPVGPRRWI